MTPEQAFRNSVANMIAAASMTVADQQAIIAERDETIAALRKEIEALKTPAEKPAEPTDT